MERFPEITWEDVLVVLHDPYGEREEERTHLSIETRLAAVSIGELLRQLPADADNNIDTMPPFSVESINATRTFI